ncbi:hypothetical protein ACFYO2_34450 [Streptomyces sp. NPDC006602]|uniref:hypothetical protein n=1 Tax=Streptomyces sp. NPDC006602 TaxID=3364751 RepID=UPI0036AA3229
MAEIQIEFNVPAEMRDGRLRADVYRPGGTGPWPVLLSRLPHGQQTPMMGIALDPLRPSGHRAVPLRSDLRMETDRVYDEGARSVFVAEASKSRTPITRSTDGFPARHRRAAHADSRDLSLHPSAGSAFFMVS